MSAFLLPPRATGEGDHAVVEGASAADAPSVTPPMAPRHLPRFAGEEK
jgi:hypothetical protein